MLDFKLVENQVWDVISVLPQVTSFTYQLDVSFVHEVFEFGEFDWPGPGLQVGLGLPLGWVGQILLDLHQPKEQDLTNSE